MAGVEAERLMADGVVDRADVTKTLKPKPGEDLRDVVLRLTWFPEVKAAIDRLYRARMGRMGSGRTATARDHRHL